MMKVIKDIKAYWKELKRKCIEAFWLELTKPK